MIAGNTLGAHLLWVQYSRAPYHNGPRNAIDHDCGICKMAIKYVLDNYPRLTSPPHAWQVPIREAQFWNYEATKDTRAGTIYEAHLLLTDGSQWRFTFSYPNDRSKMLKRPAELWNIRHIARLELQKQMRGLSIDRVLPLRIYNHTEQELI